jgi:3-polyprenyl-4-hydroxybenzoate decarboxylase
VETTALGFVNGGTSFSDIVKISTLVEGTAARLGSNTPANTTLRLTWNVAADWNTNFGQVQVEILAKDSRALLPFHWITLPASGTNPAVTINDRPIYDADLLPIWYWLIAKSDPGLQLVNGQVLGLGGDYNSDLLAQGTAPTLQGRDFLGQQMNLRPLSGGELMRANNGRYGFSSVDLYSVGRGFKTSDRIYTWAGGSSPVQNRPNIRAVAVGAGYTLILSGNGVVASGGATVPANATNVIAIAAGGCVYPTGGSSLALRADGTVIGWGWNGYGQLTIPASATNVTAIAAGSAHSLALRADGTVIGWGDNWEGQITIPASATNVTAIAAGNAHSLALRSDGTVIGWGGNYYGQVTIPAITTNVTAIAAGSTHSLALRADGKVIGWGGNYYGQVTIPASATNVIAIAAGESHSLALRADGTVLAWGDNSYGQLNVPADLSSIDLLGGGGMANHVVVVDKRTP